MNATRLKRWQLWAICPIIIPLHDLTLLVGRCAGRVESWAENNCHDSYLAPMAFKYLFGKDKQAEGGGG